ncbi:MAG TPA: protein kinase, partial [Verrucomicrobiae bacterium]|nr:protein kinase [Verrucomicrobiae bacterium]
MNSTRTCERCGTVVPADAPDNLCLRCLFDTAVDLDDAETPGAQVPTPANKTLSSVQENTPPPIFGDYELLAELGRGGQGVVYRARHRGLGRLVALKTIPPAHLASRHARERFRQEARTASRLDHPNIVPIYEVGERDGFCFYSMKLVEGVTIQQLVSRGVPDAAACRHVAAILIKVAHAVHHAHQRGVLHRDLKPSNVLLDHEDEPHVSDFGLARQTDEDSSLTLSQALIGTPAYLPPEVALGGARQATVAADIYGLGSILYQLLTGQSPFVRATIAETLRAVQDEEPLRPCRLNLAVPADLETICLKCLEKEPGKRYGTAQELADDLERFLRDEPIHARPVARAERAWRWCRRKPALASFVAATALLLLAILFGSPIALYRINQARKAEQVQLKRADEESLKARQFAYASDMNLAHQAIQEDDFYRALQSLERHRPRGMTNDEFRMTNSDGQSVRQSKFALRTSADLRGWEWRYLWRQCQGEERFILGQHTNGATAVGLLADGKTVFSAGRDKCVRLWDLESRRSIGVLPHAEEVIGAAASADGRWLATANRKDAAGLPVLLWDLATEKIVAILTTNFYLRPGSIAFSPDSKWLAFATMWGGLRLWDVDARREVTTLPASNKLNSFLGLAFSPDSRTLAYNENEYGAIPLWDIASRSLIGRLSGHQSAVTALAFSPDGQTLASGSDDRTARLWNLAERRQRFAFTNHSGGFARLAFSPDGSTLAMSGAGGAGRVIRLVDVKTGNQKPELRGHLKDISSLAFTRDGQTLLSASDDGTIRVWDLVPRAKEKSAHVFAWNSISTAWSTYGPALCLSPDGRHLLTVYTNQTFSVWDTLRLAEGENHPLPFSNTTIAAMASGGGLAAFASRSGEVMLWNVELDQARFSARPSTNHVHRLVFSPDGRHLAIADGAKTLSEMTATIHDPRRTVRVWDVGARKETHVFTTEGEFPVSLTFSADAKTLMAGCWKGSVKLWPLDGPSGAVTFPGHSWWVGGLALLPDGQTLISAETDIRFWDVRTRHENALKLSPRAGAYHCLALSSDGRRFAAGASDGRITIWDVASHQEVATLAGHEE